MSKTKTGYKVVNNSLESSMQRIMSRKTIVSLGVQYKVEEWVKSKIPEMPLFVFENKEDALTYCNEFQFLKCFECEYVPSKHKVCFIFNGLFTYEVEKELLRHKHIKEPPSYLWPKGTVFADSVKLVREVEE